MAQYEIQELKDGEIFDPLLLNSSTPFTQSLFYKKQQEKINRKVKRFIVAKDNKIIVFFQYIIYPLIFGKKYLYIPYGPIVKGISGDLLVFLKQELLNILKKENAVFLRLDFTPLLKKEDEKLIKKFFYKAPLSTYLGAIFQPRTEWLLGLQKTEEEILDNMHEKTRYSIRLAKRKNIEVEIVTENFQQYFDKFYELMLETSNRNDFGLHPKEYYTSLFENNNLDKNMYLSMARHNGEILVISLIIVFRDIANFVFSGSSTNDRKICASYLAQWEAICHAKKLGCKDYNFGGIDPTGKIYKGWEGITVFKQKFGGYALEHSNFYDLIGNPFWYFIYVGRKFIKKLIS